MIDPAITSEVQELRDLADRLIARVPTLSDPLAVWRDEAAACGDEAGADELATRLRRLWLAAAHTTAQRYTRTPLAADPVALPSGQGVPFGYERDLKPEELERRADAYAPAPPGYSARHMFFGSCQSALSAILLDLSRAHAGRPLRVAHVGSYYETTDLLALFGAERTAEREDDSAIGRADLLILEPMAFAEAFRCLDVAGLATTLARHGVPPVVLVDATLSQLHFPMDRICAAVPRGATPLVCRMASMLKLDQAGLELANAGLLSLYAGDQGEALDEAAERLAKIRSATGTGLSFAELCALDAPWFLDATDAAAYGEAVFANNKAAAERLAGHPLFAAVHHPSLTCSPDGFAQAPFLALTLADATAERYRRLERLIGERATSAGLLLRKGGSFGFRTHRFELVEPEGAAPFLRLCMGASHLSRDGVPDLLIGLGEADLR